MTSSAEKEKKKDVFKWSEDDIIALCDACLRFISKNGRGQYFRWKEIQTDVEKVIGRQITNCNSCKSKYDGLKKDWVHWRSLKQSLTGLGWDSLTGKIDATDDWWQKKIQENNNFQKFRHKGVTAEFEDKLNQLFNDAYATGDHVATPSREPTPIIDQEETENFEVEDVENPSLDAYFHNSSFTSALNDDENFLQNFVAQASETTSVGPDSQVTNQGGSSKAQVSNKSKKVALNNKVMQMKRRRRQSAGSSLLSESISEMTKCVKKMTESSSADVSSVNRTPDQSSTIPLAMNIINRMVGSGDIQECGELWGYTIQALEDPTRREFFLNMGSDSSRLGWIKYLFSTKDNKAN